MDLMMELIEDWSSLRAPRRGLRALQGLAGSLPEAPGPTRDAAVLAAVQAGEADVRWAPLQVGPRLKLAVMADALKVEGVRVGAGASLAQQVADALGAMLLTPKVLDLMYAARALTIEPMTQYSPTEMMKTSWFVKESSRIDDAIAKAGGMPSGILQTVGKPWMLTNGLLAHPGRACNYGWHVPPGSVSGSPPQWKSTPAYLSVTLPNVYVLQQPGYAHGLEQADYSEMIVLMSRTCTLDGQESTVEAILSDPALAGLISHEGVIKVPGMRQPGVMPVEPIAGAKSPGGGSLAILSTLLIAGAMLLV